MKFMLALMFESCFTVPCAWVIGVCHYALKLTVWLLLHVLSQCRKIAGSTAWLVECFPGIFEILSSIPSAA